MLTYIVIVTDFHYESLYHHLIIVVICSYECNKQIAVDVQVNGNMTQQKRQNFQS